MSPSSKRNGGLMIGLEGCEYQKYDQSGHKHSLNGDSSPVSPTWFAYILDSSFRGLKWKSKEKLSDLEKENGPMKRNGMFVDLSKGWEFLTSLENLWDDDFVMETSKNELSSTLRQSTEEIKKPKIRHRMVFNPNTSGVKMDENEKENDDLNKIIELNEKNLELKNKIEELTEKNKILEEDLKSSNDKLYLAELQKSADEVEKLKRFQEYSSLNQEIQELKGELHDSSLHKKELNEKIQQLNSIKLEMQTKMEESNQFIETIKQEHSNTLMEMNSNIQHLNQELINKIKEIDDISKFHEIISKLNQE
jgi:chromosome segregation ATPase